MHDNWIAERMRHIELSGVRKVFELARSLKNPINLSIGQPDFDVPARIKEAAKAAIDQGKNGYTVTQGISELRSLIQADIQRRYPHPDREVLITSGTSGGLLLALCCTVNPGDEVIVFDPYFVSYPHLVTLTGGRTIAIETYPNFEIDLDRVREALSPRTKLIIVNSPANPTGVVYPPETLRALAELAGARGVLLLSDEIYSSYCYDTAYHSPAEFNEQVVVFDGFSKTYGMTGWRLGYVHGPRPLIEEMTKLQQFSFVCAPSMVQHAGIAAWGFDASTLVAHYRRNRDRIYQGLRDRYELSRPEGAFYAFPKAPRGTGTEFVAEAIQNNLLIIPGNVFSRKDSHFRLSYSVDDDTLDRGIEVLNRLAAKGKMSM
jgi:aspartate aminotransferase/aminotransferase